MMFTKYIWNKHDGCH